MSGRRLATGIYADRHGYELRWQDAGRTQTKHFPTDTPLATLKEKRATYAKQARRPRPDETGSFPRVAVRFLSSRRALVSFKSDRAHLRPWIRRFRSASVWAISGDQIRKALDDWQRQGYSARTLRHRLRILRQLYATLDPLTPNPCAGVHTPTPPKRRPYRVSDAVINAVALQLRKQEMDGIGRLRTAKTRARFLMLFLTGMRPAQLMRLQPHDLDFTERLITVQPAKGDNGALIYMNDDIVMAAQLFVAAEAWGAYDSRSFAKTLQRNGWPKGVRPYTMRHKVGQTLRARGADLGDIQDHLGHASPTTTRQHYLEPDLARLKATSERLDSRLDKTALLHRPTTGTTPQKGTTRQKTPKNAREPGDTKGRLRGSNIAKTA